MPISTFIIQYTIYLLFNVVLRKSRYLSYKNKKKKKPQVLLILLKKIL